MSSDSDESSRGEHSEGSHGPFFNLWRSGLCVIFLVSVAAYWPSLAGQPVWDDHFILTGQAYGGASVWNALSKPLLGYFRPVTALSYWFDHVLYGTDPFGYHLTSVLIHAITAVLVAISAKLLFKNTWAALAAGLVFTVEPAQLGAVAWIGGRTDELSALFIAAYLGALIQHCKTDRRGWLYASLAALALACLTKEQNVAMVLLAPLVLKVCGPKRRPWKRAFVRSKSFIGVAIGFGVVWFMLQPHLHSPGPVDVAEIAERAAMSGVHYGLLALGLNRETLFTFSLFDYRSADTILAGVAIWIALGIGTFFALRKPNELSIAFSVFLLSFLPIANLVPLPSLLAAPYRLAVGGIGLCLFVAWLARRSHWTVALIPLAAWLWTTATAMPLWARELDFFETVSNSDPGCFNAEENYVALLVRASQDHGQAALDESGDALDWVYHGRDWKSDFALRDLELHRITDNDGGSTDPRRAVATMMYLRSEALDMHPQSEGADADRESQAMLNAAHTIDPSNAKVLGALGDEALSTDRGKAISYYEEALKADPRDWENLRRLARQRAIDHRLKDSEELYRKAVAEAPLASIVWIELAHVLELENDTKGAIQALEESKKGYNFDVEGVNRELAKLRSQPGSR